MVHDSVHVLPDCSGHPICSFLNSMFCFQAILVACQCLNPIPKNVIQRTPPLPIVGGMEYTVGQDYDTLMRSHTHTHTLTHLYTCTYTNMPPTHMHIPPHTSARTHTPKQTPPPPPTHTPTHSQTCLSSMVLPPPHHVTHTLIHHLPLIIVPLRPASELRTSMDSRCDSLLRVAVLFL